MEIKPCPKCGAKPVLLKVKILSIKGFLCYCSDCGHRGPLKKTEDESFEAWNERCER